MNKYDCTRALDYQHELDRLCANVSPGPGCTAADCPLGALPTCGRITEESIPLLQEWSDTHPEPPKIRKEDLAFIKAFKIRDSKYIERHQGHLRVVTMYGSQEFEIWPSMFPFIEEGQSASFIDMLRMEVEK